MALNMSQSPWAVTYSASHSLADNKAAVLEKRWLSTFAQPDSREAVKLNLLSVQER